MREKYEREYLSGVFPAFYFLVAFFKREDRKGIARELDASKKREALFPSLSLPVPTPFVLHWLLLSRSFVLKNRQAENIKSLHRLRTFRLQKAKPSNFHIKSYYKTVLSNKRENALFLGIRIRTLTSQSVNK